ncbi:sensor histidine kinase [Burkholderia vietnamiensis]|uniref:sensor histidine kinase n=1 Tax=Burkholderia vietnamiensis TaxID=60552 RepID=UPI000756475C|nr:sensor histidine kinase [Burkholderia vietnamiensis]AOK43813.1 hypothetical protein WL96_22455 [Burkholderia vietnamiensis]KVE08201.1 hypothetical protein WI91_07105 [Burkholderia vietnamiensis]HDR9183807.1 GHKL domain-containing protein [Burkholderia vietnamiensis]
MYSILPAFVSALFLGFGVYVWLTEGVTRRSTPFVLMCMTTFVWQGTWAFLFQTSQPDVARVLAKVGYLFIMFLPTTFYHFVTATVARRNERPLLLASYAISAVLAVLLLTGNEVVDGVRQFAFGDYPRAGRLHPVHVVQTIVLAGRSGWLLVTARRRAARGRDERKLLDLCLLSLGLYSLAAIDYAVNYGYPFYPPGVVFIALSLGILAVTIVRYRLMRPFLVAATVAHEVTTPLATIGMYVAEIDRALPALLRGYQLAVTHRLVDGDLDTEQLERLPALPAAIRHQVDSTHAMVKMSLAMFTLDSVDRQSFSTHSIGRCIDVALDCYPFSAGERERVDVAPIDPQLQYFGSDSLMLFVVFNLLKNALHATMGGTTGRIEILAERDDGSCVLQIRDTGTGIDANVLPHIFDPFYSTKSHGRGAGLGLAYCRRVCEMFGGQISCESVPGVMTTFTIRLPEAGSPASRR